MRGDGHRSGENLQGEAQGPPLIGNDLCLTSMPVVDLIVGSLKARSLFRMEIEDNRPVQSETLISSLSLAG